METNRLHGCRQSLGEKLDILCALDTEILGTLGEEDAITEEIDRSSEFRLKIQEAICAIENYFEQVKNDRRDSLNNFSFNNSKNNHAKLPKLSIKLFSGNPIEFQGFWDSFEAAVNSNQLLEDIVKFNYLKSFFEGSSTFRYWMFIADFWKLSCSRQNF